MDDEDQTQIISKTQSFINKHKKMEEFINTYDYQNQVILGQGGFGRVYYIKRISDQKVFAYKQLIIEESMIEDVNKEITNISMLNHQNIMKVFEIYVQKQIIPQQKAKFQINIILEYMPYNLDQKIREKCDKGQTFTDQDIKIISKQCLEALDHMKSKKIFHRDVKPQNILCDDDLLVKFADFGISKQAGSLDDPTMMTKPQAITELYSCPQLTAYLKKVQDDDFDEQLKINWEKADIYSLGLVLLILKTGYSINKQKNKYLAQKLYGLNVENGQSKTDTLIEQEIHSPSLKQLLQGMLQHDEGKRFNIEQCVNSDFFKENEDQVMQQRNDIQEQRECIIRMNQMTQDIKEFVAKTDYSYLFKFIEEMNSKILEMN